MPPSVFSGAGYGCGQQIVETISAVFPFDKIKIDRSFVKEFVERTD
jgi:predicted signal transduction protein with EAL and GGDEF domain